MEDDEFIDEKIGDLSESKLNSRQSTLAPTSKDSQIVGRTLCHQNKKLKVLKNEFESIIKKMSSTDQADIHSEILDAIHSRV